MTPAPDLPSSFLDDPTPVVEATEALVGIDTQNPPGETAAAIDWLEAAFEAMGLPTDRFSVDPAKPNLLTTLPGETDRTLCLLGHVDTVPFDRGAWSRDPLGERDGDRLYGRGTTDMKGAVAAMVTVARAFAEAGRPPPVTLRFAFVSDEETGGEAGLSALLEADRLEADACVIGEPTGPPARPSIAVADRGSIWLTMAATGEAAHGSRPLVGTNAIDRLYAGIETLRERFGSRPLELDEAVAPIVEESVAYYADRFGEAAAQELFEHPSINFGTIEGGAAINAVPASAQAEIDIRLAPGVDTRRVLAAIRACADDCEGVSLTDVSWSVGTSEPVGSPLVEAVAEAAASVTDRRVYRRSATGGGDAKKLRRAGIPTVDFAIAAGEAHAVDEHTTVESLVDTARVYAALPGEFARRLD